MKNSALKILLGGIIVLACSACSEKDLQGKRAFDGLQKPGGGRASKVTNATDYAACSEDAPEALSLRTNMWYIKENEKLASGSVEYVTRIQFLSATLSYSVACKVLDAAGKTVATHTAKIEPGFTASATEVKVANSLTESVSLPLADGSNVGCAAALEAETYLYAFQGRCLVMSLGTDELVFAPLE